jgi:hypothetical protein
MPNELQEADMHHYFHRLQDPETVYGLVRDIFLAAAITCFLDALHRIAKGLTLSARVDALEEFEDDYTPEEREVLIHKIKVKSLHC